MRLACVMIFPHVDSGGASVIDAFRYRFVSRYVAYSPATSWNGIMDVGTYNGRTMGGEEGGWGQRLARCR